MSAAEHTAARHNAAAAAARRPRPRTDGVREAGRPRTAAPTAVRRSLRRHPPLSPPLHAEHRRQGGQGIYPQTQTMHGSCSAADLALTPWLNYVNTQKIIRKIIF